jgi:hypothetical protein
LSESWDLSSDTNSNLFRYSLLLVKRFECLALHIGGSDGWFDSDHIVGQLASGITKSCGLLLDSE